MRVLFIYPNKDGIGTIPLGISMMSAALKKAGHEARVFDSTFFEPQLQTIGDRRVEVGSHLESDLTKYLKYHSGKIEEGFIKTLEEYSPHLLALSVVSYNYQEGLNYLKMAKEHPAGKNLKTIVGGTHANVAPEEVIGEEWVDMVCVGEGEEAIVELCDCLERGQSPDEIRNIWFKQNRKVKKNALRPLSDMNSREYPDFSVFDDSHFYKPFVGKVYRVAHLELSRGCPYQCTYCVNKHYQEMFKGLGKYHREKSVEKSIREIKFLQDKYRIEMIKFWDETFLVMKKDKFNEFLEVFSQEVNLPFMINTRPETVTEDRVRKLKEAGCVAVSMGVESGNDFIRRKVMKRNVSREVILRAFRIVNDFGIRTSSFNMIGLPFETRKTVFDTIELNRRAKPITCAINIFYPYQGTRLKELCAEFGLIEKDSKMVDIQSDSVLKMPQISKKEILSLRKTFLLYIKLPRWSYFLIRLSEFENIISNLLFKVLIKIMQTFYMKQQRKTT